MPLPKPSALLLFLCLIKPLHGQLPKDLFSDPAPRAAHFVDSVYNSLTTKERVGQMVFVAAGSFGIPYSEVQRLAGSRQIGGIIFLGGTASGFAQMKKELDSLTQPGVPLTYSIDAEPSLIPYKLKNITEFAKTNSLDSKQAVDSVVYIIDSMLLEIGIGINYAPVCDLSPKNEVIKHRSFGANTDSVTMLAKEFVQSSLRDGVLPVIKHFPGHGLVQGDSHKQLVYIDGPMKELPIFRHLISWGAPCVMVGHIALRNNTLATELPATCSREIVTKLLRDSLGFQGLIVTDAFNMGAVANIPNAPFLAMQAGCDIVLMPNNVDQLLNQALIKAKEDEHFALQLETSAKKVLLLKYYQGLFD
ncbi:MAG: glycoside hydrolase family 3 protein [Bacteroidetes bacterium]|nr:glycoside hydrolase family 3 protein [Bacteroidota bacterium]